MPARLVLLGLFAALAVPAVRAQSGGILAVRPAPSLSVDLGLGPHPTTDALAAEPARSAAGPRGRGAARGAKVGALVGLGVGGALTVIAYALDAKSGCSNDGSFCAGTYTALATIPFTVLTTGVGAAIGAAMARPERISPPALEAP